MIRRTWRACGHAVELHHRDECPGGDECERCGELVAATDPYGLCDDCREASVPA